MAKVPAQQLSLEYLSKLGHRVALVERFIPKKPSPIKQDMFGLFDLVALHKEGVSFIQCTSDAKGGGLAARRKKLEDQQELMSLCHELRVDVILLAWKKKGRSYELRFWKLVRGPLKFVMREMLPMTMADVRAYYRQKAQAGKRESTKGSSLGSRSKR